MSGIGPLRDADLRLAILQILDADTGTENDATLLAWLDRYGHAPSTRQLRDALAWLDGARCLRLTALGPSGAVRATLTTRGADVARGRETVPGVLRPDPD